MVTEPKSGAAKKPQPHLAALGALAASAFFGYLLYDSIGTGRVDFRRMHFALADEPELYWAAEAFLAFLLLASLFGLFISVRAMLRPEPPALGPPPELK